MTPRGAGRHGFARLRAVLSGALLVTVVFGVPAVLFAVGGSPFGHLKLSPTGRALAASHQTDGLQVATQWLAHAALLFAWMSWGWVTVCVALELRAWVTGRRSVRLPASRGLQSVVACLVGTALALLLISRASPGTSPAGPASQVVATLGQLRVIEDPESPEGPETSFHGPARQSPETVADGDDGYWFSSVLPSPDDRTSKQVAPAQLLGLERAVLEPDPHDRVDPAPPGDRTGSSLVRMAEAPALSPSRRTIASVNESGKPDAELHRVRSRETLWSIAAARLGSARRWKELAELNYGVVQPDGGRLGDDHWVRAGWMLRLPGDEGSHDHLFRTDHRPLFGMEDRPAARRRRPLRDDGRPDRGPNGSDQPALAVRRGTTSAGYRQLNNSVVMPVGRSGAKGLNSGEESRFASCDDRPGEPTEGPAGPRSVVPHSPHGPQRPVAPLGAGVVGAGVAHILDRMRRAQQRHRQEGSYIALPSLDERVFEQRLRVGDGMEVARDVDRALRYLAQWWGASGRRVPVVIGVTVDPESITVVVDQVDPVDPPRPVTIGDDGQSLLVDRAGLSELPEVGRRQGPTRVPEGRGKDGCRLLPW